MPRALYTYADDHGPRQLDCAVGWSWTPRRVRCVLLWSVDGGSTHNKETLAGRLIFTASSRQIIKEAALNKELASPGLAYPFKDLSTPGNRSELAGLLGIIP